MRILSNKWNDLYKAYYVLIETKSGRRYHTVYTDQPTNEEVKEDWKIDKSAFTHIN